jgi:hypothetical protein
MAEQPVRMKPYLEADWHSSRWGHLIIGVISLQLCIRLHQCLLADRLLDFHLRFAIDIDARLKNNLSKEVAKRETSNALITGL